LFDLKDQYLPYRDLSTFAVLRFCGFTFCGLNFIFKNCNYLGHFVKIEKTPTLHR